MSVPKERRLGAETPCPPSQPQTETRIAGARARATKNPATAPAGPADAVLVNTFFWKILVTRVNKNFRPALTAARRIPDPLLYGIKERPQTSVAGTHFYFKHVATDFRG